VSPRPRARVDKSKRKLTLDEEISLAFGAPSEVFPTYAEARAAYFTNRDRMTAYFRAGHRPTGWWILERGEDPPKTCVDEAARLAQLGELDEREVAEIRSGAHVGGASLDVWRAVEAALAGESSPR
jgi:hypothetical protein